MADNMQVIDAKHLPLSFQVGANITILGRRRLMM
jgi:hypothetical protein